MVTPAATVGSWEVVGNSASEALVVANAFCLAQLKILYLCYST
jgi:hypothetical protein